MAKQTVKKKSTASKKVTAEKATASKKVATKKVAKKKPSNKRIATKKVVVKVKHTDKQVVAAKPVEKTKPVAAVKKAAKPKPVVTVLAKNHVAKSKVAIKTRTQEIADQIRELNKEGLEKVLATRAAYIRGLASKSEAESVYHRYKKVIVPEIKKLAAEAKKLNEYATPDEVAVIKGAVNFPAEMFHEGNFLVFAQKLEALRENGEYEVGRLRDLIKSILLKKNMSREDKTLKVNQLKEELEVAKRIQKENAPEVKKLRDQADKIATFYGEEVTRYQTYYSKAAIKDAKLKKTKLLEEENKRFEEVKNKVNKDNLRFVSMQHKSNVSDIYRSANEEIANAKDAVYNSYLAKYNYYRLIRNNKLKASQSMENSKRNYCHNFTVGGFFARNALYIAILIFFVTCVVLAEVKGNHLLSGDNIITILSQSSTRVFFSLGVAGLILLGGTDLSIGRMTGMAASLSCLFLSQGVWKTNFFGIDFTGLNPVVSVILGLAVCIFVCVLFSSLAGFFTAKFNMHPFITTLSTQLLIFGIMMVLFSQVSAFKMNDNIKNAIVGTKGWQLILFAAIIILILWFIWNKTKFGRHMYAVGDNKEAAKVSGINVFSVTMGVFVLAGVCYGLGGFLEGARIGSANPSLGLGTELDAIAACVIGGISFSGGRGKVRGAVIGTIIFTTLTYCLNFLGVDSNYQYIFKGVIILAAVCLDSLKFIKKK